jgi:hypothetical protein
MDSYIAASCELLCEGIAKERISNEEIAKCVTGKHTCWQGVEVENWCVRAN